MFISTNAAGEDDDDYIDYLEARAYENDEKISADDFLRKIYSNIVEISKTQIKNCK